MKRKDKKKIKAKIAFEDGRIFEGVSFGAAGEKSGEAVFNTSLTGYQEVLTDPSYKGQIVTMTYPLIGNYGTNKEDVESRKIFLEGFIVREKSRIVSNWRGKKSLDKYLKTSGVMGIEGVDTRAITRHVRVQGAMKAVISTKDLNDKSLVKKAKASLGLVGRDLVKHVTCRKEYTWAVSKGKKKFKVIALDCGIKYNILRNLDITGCRTIVVPANTSAYEILNKRPDGVFLSNGPGDPAAVGYVIETVKQLLGRVPIFGICLGHQMLAHALGGKTYKLKFGHHGGNQPVKDLKTSKIAISVQNHGFCVDINSLNKRDVAITHINLNDNTLEGIKHKRLPVFSVQFHPEAGPGPHDAQYLFREFVEMMEKHRIKY